MKNIINIINKNNHHFFRSFNSFLGTMKKYSHSLRHPVFILFIYPSFINVPLKLTNKELLILGSCSFFYNYLVQTLSLQNKELNKDTSKL